MIHVYPLDETARHDLSDSGTGCACHPRIDLTLPEMLVIHRSADARELVEDAEALVNGAGRDVEGAEGGSCKT